MIAQLSPSLFVSFTMFFDAMMVKALHMFNDLPLGFESMSIRTTRE
jgi:hypothetical protein